MANPSGPTGSTPSSPTLPPPSPTHTSSPKRPSSHTSHMLGRRRADSDDNDLAMPNEGCGKTTMFRICSFMFNNKWTIGATLLAGGVDIALRCFAGHDATLGYEMGLGALAIAVTLLCLTSQDEKIKKYTKYALVALALVAVCFVAFSTGYFAGGGKLDLQATLDFFKDGGWKMAAGGAGGVLASILIGLAARRDRQNGTVPQQQNPPVYSQNTISVEDIE